MGTFRAAVVARTNKPARVVSLPASAWAHPPDDATGDVQMGLRPYSEADAIRVRAEAAGRAWRQHPQHEDADARIDAFNGILMALLVAQCCCSSVDATIGYFGREDGAGAEEHAQRKLTPGGIEFLFGELDALMTEDSPIAPMAGDSDLAWLSTALADGKVWGAMSAGDVRRVRRMLMRAITDMGGVAVG